MNTRRQPTTDMKSRSRSRQTGPSHDWSDGSLARAVQEDAEPRKRQALTVLIERHSDLVEKVASMFRSHALLRDDLVSEGTIGLMKAAEKYRPGKGASFRTYAVFWIRRAMHRAIDNHAAVVRIPPASGDRFRKLQATRRTERNRLGREPTIAETAAAMGVSECVVRNLHSVDVHIVSIDARINETEELCVGDTLPDEHVPDPVSILMNREHLDLLHQGVRRLDRRESEVINRRCGLGSDEPETLEGIGRRIGVTKECVRKIQKRSIQRLHEFLSPHAEDLCTDTGPTHWGELLTGMQVAVG